jgi:uncharacterized membrane protein
MTASSLMSCRPSKQSGGDHDRRGSWALVGYVASMAHGSGRTDAYKELRWRLGRAILLGLEVLIVGDIVRTIVTPTVDSVVVLGLIVVIRIVLSFYLEVEMDGLWPWDHWRLAAERNPEEPPSG